MSWVRRIGGVIVGYLCMAILVMVCLMGLYFLMPIDSVYQPGNWDPTTVWCVAMLAMSFVAAVIGGLVCALIAPRGSRTTLVFAAIVLVLGLAQIFLAPQKDEPLAREPGATKIEGLQTLRTHPRQPLWYMAVVPIVGAGGVLLGGKIRGGKREPAPEAAD